MLNFGTQLQGNNNGNKNGNSKKSGEMVISDIFEREIANIKRRGKNRMR